MAARTALVLQGGGALGAYELGAAKALYEEPDFAPDLIAGVSIGAVTAALLGRPAEGLTPLEALQSFWDEVKEPGFLFPPLLRRYASFFGNPHFYEPRPDFLNWPNWTYFYSVAPLRRTLADLINFTSLADRDAAPELLVSATDLQDGHIQYFHSREQGLTLDHIIASGSLPPAFPSTMIKDGSKERFYWDGGLFDNTPLGAVLDRLDRGPEVRRTVYVISLFPNKAPLPRNLLQVYARMKDLQFANKSQEDVKLLKRFNKVAKLVEALEKLPGGNPLKADPAFTDVEKEGWIQVPDIISVPPPEKVQQFDDSDFSPEAVQAREEEGYEATKKALAEAAARRAD
jgi:NTE family protein